jgi:hypothetical protein
MNRAPMDGLERDKPSNHKTSAQLKIIQLQDERRRDSRGKISKTTMLRLQRDKEETRNLMEKYIEQIQKC